MNSVRSVHAPVQHMFTPEQNTIGARFSAIPSRSPSANNNTSNGFTSTTINFDSMIEKERNRLLTQEQEIAELQKELGVGKSATDCFVSVSGPSNQAATTSVSSHGVPSSVVLRETSAWSSAAFQLRVTLAAIDTKRAAVVQPAVKKKATSVNSNADTANVRLPPRHMDIFGYRPANEPLVLVRCKQCRATVRVSRFGQHLDHCADACDAETALLSVAADAPRRHATTYSHSALSDEADAKRRAVAQQANSVASLAARRSTPPPARSTSSASTVPTTSRLAASLDTLPPATAKRKAHGASLRTTSDEPLLSTSAKKRRTQLHNLYSSALTPFDPLHHSSLPQLHNSVPSNTPAPLAQYKYKRRNVLRGTIGSFHAGDHHIKKSQSTTALLSSGSTAMSTATSNGTTATLKNGSGAAHARKTVLDGLTTIGMPSRPSSAPPPPSHPQLLSKSTSSLPNAFRSIAQPTAGASVSASAHASNNGHVRRPAPLAHHASAASHAHTPLSSSSSSSATASGSHLLPSAFATMQRSLRAFQPGTGALGSDSQSKSTTAGFMSFGRTIYHRPDVGVVPNSQNPSNATPSIPTNQIHTTKKS
mmetsp:Transcript_16637/g.28694  ORF Transcript_16637/g.28694 Transcript_16637/m.28694 type:complete len:593 (-) Transcript_16637:253-2031(-)